MTVYLAARYSRREELCIYADELRSIGHEVTSRWLDGNHEQADESDPTNEDLRHWAVEDIDDIDRAGWVICFTGGEKSTGRNIEFGYALGRGAGHQLLGIVGPRESVFHHLPCVKVFDTWADCLAHFKRGMPQRAT